MQSHLFRWHAQFILITGVLFTCFISNNQTALSQTLGPIPQLALEVAPYLTYEMDEEVFYSQVLYSKVAPPAQFAPDSRSTGLIQTVFLSAGTRTKDFARYDFRWRAGLLNMDIIRFPLSMGITLFDYNQADRLETDFRWFNLRVGPSFYAGDTRNYFTLRLIGSLGLTTATFGEFSYAGLSTSEGLSLRKRSYEVGYLGEFFFFFASRFGISGSFSHRHLLGGIRPLIYTINSTLGARINEFISFRIIYTIEASYVGSSSLDKSFVGLGLGLLI